ncbi:MAG TPA: hypothetical protein VLA66_09995, partial [Thermoanaerobaculia bacterium]|nr:hypothetical protein [Thermoanaerobaculia bacterium]
MPPRTEPPSLRRRLRSAALGDLERFLSGLVGRFDRPGAQQLGRVLGAAAWPLARRDRRRTLEHLGIAFPDLDAADRERLGRRCFRHFGCVLAECLWLRDRGPEEVRALVDLEG